MEASRSEGEYEEEPYSDSSVDLENAQIPVECYLPKDSELTLTDRRSWRLIRHLLKLTQFRMASNDEFLVEMMGEYRNELEAQGLSFTEIVAAIGAELNQTLVQRGNKNINTTTRSRANLRGAVMKNVRYWKIPPPILEDLLLKYSGPDSSRGNMERYQKITEEIEAMVEGK
jgi:hypothetical protein